MINQTRARLALLPLCFYIAAALFITWPAVTQLTTHAIGGGFSDQFENVRMIWYVRYALAHGLSPFYHSLLGWPTGFFNAPQWSEPLTYLPAVPLAYLSSDLTAYNLYMLAQIILAGWAAFYLIWQLTERRAFLPALLGGLIYMSYPAVQGHLAGGHSGVLTLWPLPLYALALWQIVRANGGRRWIIFGALMAACEALGNGVQMVFTLFPLTLFFLGWHLVAARGLLSRQTLLRLTAMAALTVLLLAPFFAPLAAELLKPVRTADFEQGGWVQYSADLLGFAAPAPFTPWWGAFAPGYSATVLGTNMVEGSAYLGVLVVALCLVGWRLARRNRAWPLGPARLWLAVLLGCMVFSLGPLLKVNEYPVEYRLGADVRSNILLPYAAVQSLPLISSTRTPGRYNLTAGLALAVLAAGAAMLILEQIRRSGGRVLLTGALAVLILLDYQNSFPFWTTLDRTPEFLADLRDDTTVRAVFDIPWNSSRTAQEALHYQTRHEKPLIAGHVVRRTPVDPNKLDFLEGLLTGAGHDTPLTDAQVFTLLRGAGVDAVIDHYLNDVPYARLSVTPRGTDAQAAWYEIPAASEATPALVVLRQPNNDLLTYNAQDSYAVVERKDQPPTLVHLPPGYARFYAWDGAITAVRRANIAAAIIEFGRGQTLRAWEVAVKGRAVNILQNWEAGKPLTGDIHLFIHLIDASGKLVAQRDYPIETAVWKAGARISQAITLPDVPPGTYSIFTGLYDYPGMERLEVRTPGCGASDGLAYLGEVTVD